ncbi:hypothetical protein POX_a00089 [Penicillium oxalicum]|uniref:hypothetical protein n=1 Tax=Penicillium oxalicum TaxID=69781 RepID=UPI0020B66ABB|nr:hypothetical protein POX_a00089 [Penicillium oxalicum]KAI2793509.1 hypothetical protein POX_a00089 [Penicillium oxalicum]
MYVFAGFLLASLLGFEATSASKIIAVKDTPLLGPSFLTNFDLSNSSALNKAKKDLSCQIERLFSNGELNRTDVAFHIDVFSAATNKSIYSYSHVGKFSEKALTAGVFDDQTISRIGSVSKLFTAYAIIAKGGIEVLAQPVVKYLPELAGNTSVNPLERIDWENISVGTVLAQQAGTGGPQEFIVKYSNEKHPFSYSSDDLFKYMRDEKRPVISPYWAPVYSDIGYALMGQVLARLANKTTYSEAIPDVLFKPLGLQNSSTAAPKPQDGLNALNRSRVAPTSLWAVDFEIVASSGGIYANAADLRRTGLSILNSELLSPAEISEWMKPRGGTGSLVELVGAPWEIERLEIPASPGSNRTRISDLYTKAGGNGDFSALLALSPDHGIGFSILIGGTTSDQARWVLREAIGEIFIPAAELAAWENAKKHLAGTFVHKKSSNTNVTFSVDQGLAGLGLKAFWVEGKDMKKRDHRRLYPTGLNSVSRSLASRYQTAGQICVAHRVTEMLPPVKPRAAVEGGDGGLFDNSFVWQILDFENNGDEFELCLTDGKLTSVVWPLEGLVLEPVK